MQKILNIIEPKYFYDKNGNMIHCIIGDLEAWYEYNEFNKIIHYKNNQGTEIFYNYDHNIKKLQEA